VGTERWHSLLSLNHWVLATGYWQLLLGSGMAYKVTSESTGGTSMLPVWV
jgi:hypothetical protein